MVLPGSTDATVLPADPAPLPAPASARAGDERLEQDLAHALAHGQLALNYQPRVCLATRRTLRAEALARWPHRRRGMISPGVFIPLAERTGLIVELGAWALSTACAEASRWPESVAVSVNVSACQLARGTLLNQVRAALDESGLAPERLELELTESMLVDAGVETLLTLSAVRDLGIGLALDDFGTGYASLSALKRLPLTALKLDRSLVRGVLRQREDTAIARAVIATAQALDLAIVAEGVDGEAQCRFLAALGCQEGQSYFFGRPAPAERFRQDIAREIGAPGPAGAQPGRAA